MKPFCYELNPPRRTGAFSTAKMKANRHYEKHYNNSLLLRAVSAATDKFTFEQRVQAEAELAVCERKIAYWERHENFDEALAKAFREKANKFHIVL